MLVSLDNLKQLYRQILQAALQQEGSGCTAYIFTSNDTDSLCAVKILTVSCPPITQSEDDPEI
jgi:hypothetical protein